MRLLMVCLWIVMSFSQAMALTLKLDKLRVYEVAKPGTTIEGVINIINDGDAPMVTDSGINDFDFDGLTQNVLHKPFNTQPNSCSTWVSLIHTQKIIPPNSTTPVRYVIQIPKEGLNHAEYFSLIYIESLLDAPDMGSQIALGAKARMGVVVKIGIEGKLNGDGKITAFEVKQLSEGHNTLTINYSFQNTGNYLHKVRGQFSIIDSEGNLFGRGALNYSHAKPGETVSMITPWDGELESGSYDVIAEFRYDPDQVDIQEASLSVP